MSPKACFRIIIMLIISSSILQGVAESKPVPGSHHNNNDIIAGNDFLSIFLGTTKIPKPQKPIIETTTVGHDDLLSEGSEVFKTIIRDSRSSVFSTPNSFNSPSTEDGINNYSSDKNSLSPVVNTFDDPNVTTEIANEDSQKDITHESNIIGIRVSASVGMSQINKEIKEEVTTHKTTEDPRDSVTEESIFTFEQPVSINSAARRSDFNIEEKEPITVDNSMHRDRDNNVPNLAGANYDYLQQQRDREYVKRPREHYHPYHQTIIFHGQANEGNRARSVSYSSVLQAIPRVPSGNNWEETAETIEKPAYVINNPVQEQDLQKAQNIENQKEGTVEETTVSNIQETEGRYSSVPYPSTNWKSSEEIYSDTVSYNPVTSSTVQQENNWSKPSEETSTYKQMQNYLPTVYGMPEQNYEVDEAVSVMSNGRVHGVQNPVESSVKTVNDNRKVGYVVEGKNYRKYRVEERTSDGFIVGEYGVVSHNDGSLRGVRYTADGTISPRLIYDALLKFLSL